MLVNMLFENLRTSCNVTSALLDSEFFFPVKSGFDETLCFRIFGVNAERKSKLYCTAIQNQSYIMDSIVVE